MSSLKHLQLLQSGTGQYNVRSNATYVHHTYSSPVPDCLCTSVATLPTYVRDRHNYMCTLTERCSIFHKTTRYSNVVFHMIPIITSINATVASNSLVLKHKHFQVHQLLALLKRCKKRVQPSYKQMLLQVVAIYTRITRMYTPSYDKVRMHGCVHSIQTFGLHTHLSIYRLDDDDTWCASEYTSDGSESEAHWIDPVHTGFLNSWAMNALRTC